jgi:AraC family transcriptional activator of pyochelin receptor
MKEYRRLTSENGITDLTEWRHESMRLTHAVAYYNDFGWHHAHSDADVVRLHFGMKGDYSVSYKQIKKSFDLVGGHHNFFYSPQFDMEFFNKTRSLETFGIQFPKNVFLDFTEHSNDALKAFSEKILSGKYVIFSEKWGTIDLSIQQVIQQIINSQYVGDLHQLFILSKSIELLVLSTAGCLQASRKRDSFIKNNSDKEKIIAARDIINQQLKTPLLLSQISKIIGLNEYKLKHGFKEMFHTTVFGYLTQQRLDLAMNYLKETQKTVAEISFDMGYATPQHFNNAFRKKFGITPNSVRKNP